MRVRIRPMTDADIPAAMRLVDDAGWNQTSADWSRFLDAGSEGCLAATCGDAVVGTTTSIVYDGRLAWIGMVLVDASYRRQGIGTALLRRALRYLDEQGVACIKLDATPQGKPLYASLGFVPEYDVARWVLHRDRTNRAAAPAAPRETLDDALRLDRACFGADRSRLLRSLDAEAPGFTRVSRHEGQVVGYAFGRRGLRADHLGPWVARNAETAAHLLDAFLSRSHRELVFVDGLREHAWAVPLLQARGFVLARPLIRMYQGTNTTPARPGLLGAILDPAFG